MRRIGNENNQSVMPPRQLEAQDKISAAISPHASITPLISDHQREDLQKADFKDAKTAYGKDSKSLKQKILGLAGKSQEDKQKLASANMPAPGPAIGATGSIRAASPPKPQLSELKPRAQQVPQSPSRLPYQPTGAAASPSRLRSSSPRLHSPASSEIFERNVQEPIPISTLSNEVTPAHIPAHVLTEDSIPPALEASAQAITSEELNPDEVEIVTSSSHQPAAASVLESSTSHADLNSLQSPFPLRHELSADSEPSSSLHASSILPGLEDDGASNYGQLDPTDVRRLSFISFKDIVNSEQNQLMASSLGEIGSRDSLHIAGATSIGERAASPLRSPRSPISISSQTQSGGLTTPPPATNVNPMAASLEQSPVRLSSPGSQAGDLNIETMRQSIKKTASGDLSGVRQGSDGGMRSAGMSPVSDENSLKEGRGPLRNRTNS